MDKLIVLCLALVAIGLADAGLFGGHQNRLEAMRNMLRHHRKHMRKWKQHALDDMMRTHPFKSKIALSRVQCALTPTSFPKDGSEQQRTLWPSFFANVQSKEACEMLCYAEPWGCGAYVVAEVMGGPTPCILFKRSRASEMGATAELPEEMKSNATYHEMRCKGKFMNNEMLFKLGKQFLIRSMPLMLAHVDPLLKGINERLGLAEPEMPDSATNPFAKPKTGTPESHGYPQPSPSPSPETYGRQGGYHRRHHRNFHHQPANGFGPSPAPGRKSVDGNDSEASVGHPEHAMEDAPVKIEGSDPNEHPTLNRNLEPREFVEQDSIDAPEKPKVGPNGEAEEGQGGKREQEVDPDIAADRRRRLRKSHHTMEHDTMEHDTDAF
ncbi:uncharacterized protein LOC135500573 isoform X2 [Lineus longissimus]|uniref:uncharacterized protein LOC135500573 isoform X2 n=1 Tax=Lineus longissimus TaxID=88925 RepID=UPI002B4D7B01